MGERLGVAMAISGVAVTRDVSGIQAQSITDSEAGAEVG